MFLFPVYLNVDMPYLLHFVPSHPGDSGLTAVLYTSIDVLFGLRSKSEVAPSVIQWPVVYVVNRYGRRYVVHDGVVQQ